MRAEGKEVKEKGVPLSQVPWRDFLKKKEYNKDVNKMCELCRAQQVKEYGKITIPCSGLADIPEEIKNHGKDIFSKEEMHLMETIYNPYAWAKTNLKERVFADRWYQELTTRCTSRRLGLRQGRRTGKSYGFGLKTVHRIANRERVRVLMLAPMESQVKEYIEICKLIVEGFKEDYMNPYEFLIGGKTQPYYELRFSNNSRIRGFTAGKDAKGVRGQSADIIVLDEVDYLHEDAIGAIMGIMNDNPNVELWVSSTPAGKRKLYEYENSEQYKIFHYPSYVLPHYSDEIEQELRTQYGTGIKYVHETLAEYGDAELGVFQSYFINQCNENELEEWRADVLKNRHKYLVILGGDWNDDQVGTRLLSVAFSKEHKKFFIAASDRVSKEGWTQVEAVKKIIDLNRQYKYDALYLDDGYGKANIQFIKQYAIDQYGKVAANHPDLKLAEVQGINFSSSVILRDIETNEEIKRDMKAYIVENTANYLERLAILFDRKSDADLIKQMEAYEILRRTPTGKPVYGTVDERVGDHDLDAFMLALLGFNMEFSDVGKGHSETTLIVTLPRESTDPADQIVSTVFGVTEESGTLDGDNGLFITLNSSDLTSDRNNDFYMKYVANSKRDMGKGLTRNNMRSSFRGLR